MTRWGRVPNNGGMEEFLNEIRAYCARVPGLTPQALVRRFTNDGKTWTRLESGGDITLAVAERIREFMSANPPPEPPETLPGPEAESGEAAA